MFIRDLTPKQAEEFRRAVEAEYKRVLKSRMFEDNSANRAIWDKAFGAGVRVTLEKLTTYPV